MERSPGPVVAILAAAGLAASLALPSAAQAGPAADLDPADCSNGTFVARPADNPGLVADCRALTAVRNHWTRHPGNAGLPADHALLTWGRGGAKDITSWRGITVEDRRVTAVLLDRRGLSGAIPPQLSRLTHLKALDLGFNRLTGEIPSQLFHLTNLTILDLGHNGFTGEIPTQLSRLTNLEELVLSYNEFTGPISSQLSQLTELEVLGLSGNPLTGPIPLDLSKLTQLKYLHLEENDLAGQIPPELSQLTKLEGLFLEGSNLSGSIPPQLSRLANLDELNLRNNELTGPIPPQLSQLTNLTNLNLSGNKLSGPIPPGLSQLTKLQYLFLDSNQLTGPIPPQLSQLTNLRSLDLSYNRLSGPIPHELSQLTNLRFLFLFFNRFVGPIPPQITELPDLEIIYPFDADLGLLANVEESRKISLGDHLWEVWLCDTRGPLELNLGHTADLLNQTVAPYFEWLSEGRFSPRFSATGAITLTPDELADLPPGDFSHLLACKDEMMRSDAHDEMNKAVIIENTDRVDGFAKDHALAGGGAVATIPDNDDTPRLMTIAHEIGHLLGWPHSYNGLVTYDGVFDEYDNSADIMSGGNNAGLSVGTPAVNRYAAGWIDPEDVALHSGGAAVYELSPIGAAGTQMLVVPSGEVQGAFYSLSPVVAEGYNRGQPKEGVEVYLIDQSPSVCEKIPYTDSPCRRTQPYPPQVIEEGEVSAHHVREVGDAFQLGEVWAVVQARRGDRFVVAVGSGCEGYFEGEFCDDEGNVHSDSIEAVADWGITRGCRENRFCPDAAITRSQMAAFLYRAVTHRSGGEPPAPSEVTLDDVEDGAWYRLYAAWAAGAGVMRAPEGVFDPDGAVTRADMAEMMTAAFSGLPLPGAAQGVFTDMEGRPDLAVRAAEALRTAGVTEGCSASPLRFCPGQPVTRAQMASFFYRALS